MLDWFHHGGIDARAGDGRIVLAADFLPGQHNRAGPVGPLLVRKPRDMLKLSPNKRAQRKPGVADVQNQQINFHGSYVRGTKRDSGKKR